MIPSWSRPDGEKKTIWRFMTLILPLLCWAVFDRFIFATFLGLFFPLRYFSLWVLIFIFILCCAVSSWNWSANQEPIFAILLYSYKTLSQETLIFLFTKAYQVPSFLELLSFLFLNCLIKHRGKIDIILCTHNLQWKLPVGTLLN